MTQRKVTLITLSICLLASLPGLFFSGVMITRAIAEPDNVAWSTGAGVTFDSLVIPSGTIPGPDIEGAIFLDTDESVNGSLVMYSNGAWRTVKDL